MDAKSGDRPLAWGVVNVDVRTTVVRIYEYSYSARGRMYDAGPICSILRGFSVGCGSQGTSGVHPRDSCGVDLDLAADFYGYC